MDTKQAKDIILFLQQAGELKRVPRYSVSLSQQGDTVAEHSWRLALMVFLIGRVCDVQIDLQKAISMALIHDLAEAKTGDIDAYKVMTGLVSLRTKQKAEEEAMHTITQNVFFGDWLHQEWETYEAQEDLEAKFVKALDKIEAYLHIAERGIEAYVPKEFHADYADAAVKAFDEASRDFPGLSQLLTIIKEDLKQKFAKVGVAFLQK